MRKQLERIATGIPGLDTVLGGGLFEAGLYVVQGAPGTGKTILANQLCFHLARQGRRVAYLTLMAEAHDRMLDHLEGLGFVDRALLPDPLHYLSAYPTLEDEGLAGLTDLVRETVRAKEPLLIVLDGLYVAHERSESERDFRRFLYELQGEAALRNVTFLLLGSGPLATYSAEHTMVDGLIELRDEPVGPRAVRTLQVAKLRGTPSLRGRHQFRIQGDGITVYPRLETLVTRGPEGELSTARLPTGVEGLDRMLQAGLPAGSTSLLLGPSGAGKTTLGLIFLAQATVPEPGVLFGCYESVAELRLKARSVGIGVDRLIEEGALHLVWHRPFESSLDEMAYRLLDAVESSGARRLFVDGIAAFRQTAIHPERLSAFFAALSLRLRRLGVTTVCSMEAKATLEPHELPLDGISALAENIVMLRLGERQARLTRMLSIVKMRQSGFDPAIVPFAITSQGITIGGTAEAGDSGAAVSTGPHGRA